MGNELVVELGAQEDDGVSERLLLDPGHKAEGAGRAGLLGLDREGFLRKL